MRVSKFRTTAMALGCSALLLAGACSDNSGEDAPADSGLPETAEEPAPVPLATGTSIFRDDIEGQPQPALLEPRIETVRFGESADELSEEATTTLNALFNAPHIEAGSAITLRAHSDAGGSDAVNMRASEDRAETVKSWLIAKGIDEERITVIAFGEQNPAEPNALPDGSPNEAGRAANRRVEITLAAADPETDDAETPEEPAPAPAPDAQ